MQVEVRTVGRTAGAALSAVHFVRVSPRGDRVMLLSTEHLDAFDTMGTHLGTIGRSGDGPGEFRSTIYSGFGPEEFWVFDIRANRMVVLDLAELRVRSTRRAPTFTSATNLPIELSAIWGRLSSAHYVVRGSLRDDFPPGLGQSIPRGVATAAFVVIDTLGEVLRVLGPEPHGTECTGPIAPPGCQRTVAGMSDDGSRLAWVEGVGIAGESRVMRVSRAFPRTGRLDTAHVRLAAPRLEVHHQDSIRAMLVKRGVSREAVEAAVFPPRFPAASLVRPGDDGVLWIGGRADSSGRPWTLIDSLNRVIGRFYLDQELVVGGVSHHGAWAARDLPDGGAEVARVLIQR